MRFVEDFLDYELIDATQGERLERWGDIILVRPDPTVMWNTKKTNPLWNYPHAVYHRSQSGGGYWETLKKVPDVWSIAYNGLTFRLKPMGFKHTGLFPEQAVNWKLAEQLIKSANRPIKVLNLFAYTGGATVACLKAGASVTHVDASKGPEGQKNTTKIVRYVHPPAPEPKCTVLPTRRRQGPFCGQILPVSWACPG